MIDIQGVVVAKVNDKVQIEDLRIWYDPLDMFRQIAPEGMVKKEAMAKNVSPDEIIGGEDLAATETLVPAGGCPFAGAAGNGAEPPAGHPKI